jgi:hypothetical protein
MYYRLHYLAGVEEMLGHSTRKSDNPTCQQSPIRYCHVQCLRRSHTDGR